MNMEARSKASIANIRAWRRCFLTPGRSSGRNLAYCVHTPFNLASVLATFFTAPVDYFSGLWPVYVIITWEEAFTKKKNSYYTTAF